MEYDSVKPKKKTHKILKHPNQDIRESENIQCPLDIDNFTSYNKTLWSDTNCGTQNWNCHSKNNYQYYEIKREEELGKILKKLKSCEAPGADNIPSELKK